ncbi:hypothetical protein QUF72_18995 [Desulfobacterales bacterium HSG2]|nr:hypothetical protein [Desulfobacterales bacterium HSG2]
MLCRWIPAFAGSYGNLIESVVFLCKNDGVVTDSKTPGAEAEKDCPVVERVEKLRH